MREIHLVLMRVALGVWFIMIVRDVITIGMIRVGVVRILHLKLVRVMALGMGVLHHTGRPAVSGRAKKNGQQQKPTREDGVDAVLFPRTHERLR